MKKILRMIQKRLGIEVERKCRWCDKMVTIDDSFEWTIKAHMYCYMKHNGDVD